MVKSLIIENNPFFELNGNHISYMQQFLINCCMLFGSLLQCGINNITIFNSQHHISLVPQERFHRAYAQPAGQDTVSTSWTASALYVTQYGYFSFIKTVKSLRHFIGQVIYITGGISFSYDDNA